MEEGKDLEFCIDLDCLVRKRGPIERSFLKEGRTEGRTGGRKDGREEGQAVRKDGRTGGSKDKK